MMKTAYRALCFPNGILYAVEEVILTPSLDGNKLKVLVDSRFGKYPVLDAEDYRYYKQAEELALNCSHMRWGWSLWTNPDKNLYTYQQYDWPADTFTIGETTFAVKYFLDDDAKHPSKFKAFICPIDLWNKYPRGFELHGHDMCQLRNQLVELKEAIAELTPSELLTLGYI